MDFPQYRKSIDNRSFYKITSPTTFEEIQRIGQRYFFHFVQIKTYFEQLRIKSMLHLEEELFQSSDETEFDEHYRNAKEYIERKK